MAIEITVPRLGWSMEEGTFAEWLKRDGDTVCAGELLYTLDTDKVTQEVESLDAGILHIPLEAPRPGDKVLVGQRLGYLLEAGESAPVSARATPVALAAPATAVAPTTLALVTPGHTPAQARFVTPRARRVARELGIDWTALAGTGRDGRVREADVRLAAAARSLATLSPTRRVIAERMLTSQQKTAPVTLHTTADATALVLLRRELKNEAVAPTYTDMLVKLLAAALRKHPLVNSRWEGEHLVTQSAAHIGLAVDTEAGLLVPVIRDVNALPLREVAKRSRDLVERARTRRLRAEELQGGTFSVTNLGAFGIDAFTPVIHYPECAILGVGRIVRQPVAVDDSVVLQEVLTLSLTFDHCALDGAPAARFLQTLTGLIQSPAVSLGL